MCIRDSGTTDLVAGTLGVPASVYTDPARFAADMGTHFLMRLAEVASMAIARYLPAE